MDAGITCSNLTPGMFRAGVFEALRNVATCLERSRGTIYFTKQDFQTAAPVSLFVGRIFQRSEISELPEVLGNTRRSYCPPLPPPASPALQHHPLRLEGEATAGD